jgi:beta-lactamase class A
LRALVSGRILSAASSSLLVKWMQDNKTGDKRLRAGLPGIKIGDKTGSGDRGTSNDVAVMWPDQRSPVFMAVYLTGASGTPEARDAAIAAAGRAAGRILGV